MLSKLYVAKIFQASHGVNSTLNPPMTSQYLTISDISAKNGPKKMEEKLTLRFSSLGDQLSIFVVSMF